MHLWAGMSALCDTAGRIPVVQTDGATAAFDADGHGKHGGSAVGHGGSAPLGAMGEGVEDSIPCR